MCMVPARMFILGAVISESLHLGHFRRPQGHFRRHLGVLKYELVLSVTK